MSLFFIVGAPGTGKSTVRRILQSRGYEAYDTDERGFGMAQWHNNHTGYIHPKSSVKDEDRTDEFLRNHSWNVPESSIKELVDYAADGKTVFLCGDVGNERDISRSSAATFVLDVDTETLKHRLKVRTGNDWGKQPHELQLTLQKRDAARSEYKSSGYIIIDATRPAEEVVDDILDKVDELQQNNQ